MNAKSLSTILHLKQLSEQLVEQKDILEKKLKGTQQLEIAARLAANAKERVEEEATREMEVRILGKLIDLSNFVTLWQQLTLNIVLMYCRLTKTR